MPIENSDRRFIFDGSAVAFAAHIRRPEDVFVKAASASYLPVTGGLSESKLAGSDTTPFTYKGIITFSSSSSYAKGDYLNPKGAVEFTHGNHGANDLGASTSVCAQLENLTMDLEEDPLEQTPRRVFGATFLEISLESTSDRLGPVSFRSLSAKFHGITLTTFGKETSSAELIVHTATEIFDENDTKKKLVATYRDSAEFRMNYGACFHAIGTDLRSLWAKMTGRHEIPYADQGPIVATFVTKLEWKGEPPVGTEIANNRLTVSGLGRIYFGEIILDENSRRATLLRFELGSATGGEASACEAASNGTGYPPKATP